MSHDLRAFLNLLQIKIADRELTKLLKRNEQQQQSRNKTITV